jgi:hypothetical protein
MGPAIEIAARKNRQPSLTEVMSAQADNCIWRRIDSLAETKGRRQ